VKEVTLTDQRLITDEVIKSLEYEPRTDLPGAYQQCKNAIAECELLLSMLKKLESDIEYDMLEQNEEPDNYWDI
jgi:hypothetical protein